MIITPFSEKLLRINKAKKAKYSEVNLNKMGHNALMEAGLSIGITFDTESTKSFMLIKLIPLFKEKYQGIKPNPVKKVNPIKQFLTPDPDAPKALKKMNKVELVKKAESLGLNLDEQLSNKIMIKAINGKMKAIEEAEKEKMKADKIKEKEQIKEAENKVDDNNDNPKNGENPKPEDENNVNGNIEQQ